MALTLPFRKLAVAGIAGCCLANPTAAQTPAATPAPPAAIERRDVVLDAATNLIGQALFLRCFCAENNLAFDAEGKVQGAAKTTDWTLAAVNIQKAERKGPGEIELDGVRVAMRYATDRREWDRHAMPDEKVKILISAAADTAAFQRATRAVFALGIDHALQHTMPEFWQHYFDPKMPWPQDALTGKSVYNPGPQPGGQSVVAAVLQHKTQPSYTAEARHDHIEGLVSVQMTIDGEGVARRMAVVQPLGYGMDAKVVEAVTKFQFAPAKLANEPVATNELVRQQFEVVTAP